LFRLFASSHPAIIPGTGGTGIVSFHGGRLLRKPETAKEPVGSICRLDFSSEQPVGQAVQLRS